jgi:hypothetical protein
METILIIVISLMIATGLTLKFQDKILKVFNTKEKALAFNLTSFTLIFNYMVFEEMVFNNFNFLITITNYYDLSTKVGSFIIFDLITISILSSLFAFKNLKYLYKNRLVIN